mmetsp:Transcript_12586/g.47048  ORF Transcript_12586/g.47048 Transcript_12586/m.47048 type:complete len:261 (-) Transcript_12586:1152-1934(-)
MSSWYTAILASTEGSYAPTILAARSPALVLLPIATVATGTPLGICKIEYTESTPSRCFSGTGTPITGSGVIAATIPGRCAAPPAPAMMHRKPLPDAARAYSNMRSGVRCALITVTSTPIPKDSKTSAAAAMVGKSESLPMIMPTEGGANSCALASPLAIFMSWSSFATATAACVAVTVTCPIFRPNRASGLSYQCAFAPGTTSAAPMTWCIFLIASSPSPSPKMFFITTPPHVNETSPSGHPNTARRWFWYWQHAVASMV